MDCILAGALMYPLDNIVGFICYILASPFASFDVIEAAVDVLHFLFVASPDRFMGTMDWRDMTQFFDEMQHCTDAGRSLCAHLVPWVVRPPW
jgi:hypothetical protein